MKDCKCEGTMCLCPRESIQQHIDRQERDPLSGFAETIMAQVDKLITKRLHSLCNEIAEQKIIIAKESYLDGLKEGIDIGRNL